MEDKVGKAFVKYENALFEQLKFIDSLKGIYSPGDIMELGMRHLDLDAKISRLISLAEAEGGVPSPSSDDTLQRT